jgi:hypothetical protein
MSTISTLVILLPPVGGAVLGDIVRFTGGAGSFGSKIDHSAALISLV